MSFTFSPTFSSISITISIVYGEITCLGSSKGETGREKVGNHWVRDRG